MLTKAANALSILAIVICASNAVPALAKGPADARAGNSDSQVQSCHRQDAEVLSPDSDFVAIPYTFGSTLDYRPTWVGEMQPRTDVGRKMSKRHSSPSPVPHC
jgi:hypothetical protein